MFRDLGMIDHSEPFTHLLTQGMVLKDGAVMSKSKGNVVDPDTMIEKFGADALRLYVMFVAPPEKEVEWTDSGLEGSFRWLERVWHIAQQWRDARVVRRRSSDASPDRRERALRRKTHDTIRARHPRRRRAQAVQHRDFRDDGAGERAVRVHERGDGAQAACVAREALDAPIVMLSPFAPHTWKSCGRCTATRWAVGREMAGFDAEAARAEEIVIPVQVNGKVRGRLTVAPDRSDEEFERGHWRMLRSAVHSGQKQSKRSSLPRVGWSASSSVMNAAPPTGHAGQPAGGAAALSCWRAASARLCGYSLAGRGRSSVLHQDHRHSAVQQPHAAT